MRILTDHGSGANTKTNNNATNTHLSHGESRCLNNGAESEQDGSKPDGRPSAILVCSDSSNDGPDKRTGSAQGRDGFLVGACELMAIQVVANDDKHTTDHTSIVTKEHATNGCCCGAEPYKFTRRCFFDLLQVLEFFAFVNTILVDTVLEVLCCGIGLGHVCVF